MLLPWGQSTFSKAGSAVDLSGACPRCSSSDEPAKGSEEGSRDIPLKSNGNSGHVNPIAASSVDDYGK